MNINVSLTDELAKFTDDQVRLDRTEAEKLHWLQNAWREGIDSGNAGEIDFAKLKQEARRRLAAK